MTIDCYAQRLLNPFRGAINIIKYKSAEAVTTDGIHWDIYVSNDELLKGLNTKRPVQTSDIRYGRWSREEGLTRGPIFPSDDFKRLEHRGAIVYEHLLKIHNQLPFPFKDHFELWLLDQLQQPLALINSTASPDEIEYDERIAWRAGLVCNETFLSEAMEEIGEKNTEGASAGEYLSRYVNECAGPKPMAQWFHRQYDRSGIGMEGINIDAEMQERRLSVRLFPEYLLGTEYHDQAHCRLIDDFFDWQAPWLLLLPWLSNAKRERFEQLARLRATEMNKQYRFYPDIVDEAAINAARVEARMRSTSEQPSEEDDTMSTFYIEMGPTSG